MTVLEEGLSQLGLGGDDRIFSLLINYIEEIELFNTAYGLVKVRDRQEFIVKHILDSLAPIKILEKLLKQSQQGPRTGMEQPNSRWQAGRLVADVGSGAGLPGIPLAICMEAEFTLIERMGRRTGFLRDVLAMLALPNAKVEEADMEELALKLKWAGRFNLIVFRAFRPLEADILKSLLRLLAPGGFIAAYKGRRESIEEEMDQVKTSQEILPWEALPLEVPFLEEERHLLVIGLLSQGKVE